MLYLVMLIFYLQGVNWYSVPPLLSDSKKIVQNYGMRYVKWLGWA